MLHRLLNKELVIALLIIAGVSAAVRSAMVSSAAQSSSAYIWLEAESGNITSPMQTLNDTSASGGRYIQVASGNNSSSTPPTSGLGTYSFSVTNAGTYKVWGRAIAPTTSDDSFWMQMDSGSWIKWNNISLGTSWHWDDVHNSDAGNAVATFNLSVGNHTLRVAYREDGTKLDRLLVTNDLQFIPSDSSDSCVTATSGGGFKNTPFASQTGTFTAEFDATPSVANINSVIGLSNGPQTTHTGFAAIVRFNTSGNIDARNGGTYTAASTIPYSAGVKYRFRLVVNVPAKTYSIFVTTASGTERTVGTNFAFRTEQSGVTNLNNWTVWVNSTPAGSTTACNFTVSSGCSFSISPTSQSFTSAGGTGSVNVTASSANCNWTATSNASFITITSGSSGTGSGSVNFSVAQNAGPARSGTLTIAGQTFTVNQAAASSCSYSISPASQRFTSAGGSSSVSVTASTSNCGWSATSNASFITVTSASGAGNGTVNYSVAQNTGPTRSGTITIAGQTFTVSQDGNVSNASDELRFTYSTVNEDAQSFTGRIIVANPNNSYAWNGSYFAVRSVECQMTSVIRSVTTPNGPITYRVQGDVITFDLGWQSLFPLGASVEINLVATKGGAKVFPQNFKPHYVRGEDIIYPSYQGLPASWRKGKTDLVLSDLVANQTSYYQATIPAVTDKLVIYNPPHATQISLGQVFRVNYPVNTVNGVRIWIPSKYMAMGVAFVYEFFKINPNYMAALGTKENFAAGVVPPEAGNRNNPVVIDGQTWYWPIVAHVDGPYQQEAGNFNDTRTFMRDYLPPDANHDEYTAIRVDPNDLNWISSGISSGLSITVTRETLNAIPVRYNEFMSNANDPWAEFAIITFAYNRGINSFYAKKIFTDNRQRALNSTDIATEFDMGGFASHVPTVRAITDATNRDTSDLYDAQITWADMTNFFVKLRMFYRNGVPSDAEWNAMIADVQRAFNVLSGRWGGGRISFRYDFLTLLRVMKAHLPAPHNPRPTGPDWYYQIINATP